MLIENDDKRTYDTKTVKLVSIRKNDNGHETFQ